ncbi:carbon monoxide dehydrogenase maturation protein [Saccharothrix sp. AJ9571]|nr:carbon monoxide dehydrogenase maturation protein [Saccharothrix sp. AJ9571]
MLVALLSLKGSPGVTTLAVALAVQWPEAARVRRLVAEVDPSGGDLAVRLGLPLAPGLVSLAAAARRTCEPEVVWQHSQALDNGVRVLVAPPVTAHADAALRALVAAPVGPLLDSAGREPGAVVLADCGRGDPGSPAEAVARRADALLLVSGTRAEDLARTSARLGELTAWTPRSGLLLTGRGYPTNEVERELGVPVIGRVPYDESAAAALPGQLRSARWRGGAFARSTAAVARALSTPLPGVGFSAVPGVPAQQVRHPGGVVFGAPDARGNGYRLMGEQGTRSRA